MKILVTGSEGFIGSHLVEYLLGNGYDVRAFVLYNSFNSRGWLDTLSPEILKKIDFFHGDIRDSNGVNNAVMGCDAVIHLAALIAIPYSYHSPQTYIDTNISGTLNILQAAMKNNVCNVLHTSTSEVYGTAQYVPMCENHPLQGQSPYSASKIGADQLALSFHKSFELPVKVIRPFNTYGPRQSLRAIIPTIITQILGGKKVIEIGDLRPTRDFNYVEDTVRGFFAALNSPGGVGQVTNIGSGYEISISDLIIKISKIIGVDVEVKSKQERLRPESSEVFRLYCDNRKAAELFNWAPIYSGHSGLDLGLQKTINWFSEEKNRQYFPDRGYVI